MKVVNLSKRLLVFLILASPALFSHASATDACENVSEVKLNVSTSTCFQYVKGFLDGALLSDAQIMKNIGADRDSSGFFDRAFQTRVGKPRSGAVLPDTFLADFCLPEPTATDKVVLRVLESLKAVQDKTVITEQFIFNKVKLLFPCPRRR